jgi:hypothetical protein
VQELAQVFHKNAYLMTNRTYSSPLP